MADTIEKAKTAEIQKEVRDGALRIWWNNRDVRKDNFVFVFMIIFWIIWAPITVTFTVLSFVDGPRLFFLIWLIGGWAGTIGIPYSLLQRFWSGWIVISSDSISFGYLGFLTSKPQKLLLENIREITIGLNGDETMVTLNVYDHTKWHGGRHMLGYWLKPVLKEEIFRAIQEFVEANQIPVTVRRLD